MNVRPSRDNGVSFVVPMHNGSRSIVETLESIFQQTGDCPIEVIVVEDRSTDDSASIVRRMAMARPVRLITNEGRGAAAAINTGMRAARFPLICQIDQDVTLRADWLSQLLPAFDDPRVGAAQGYYETDRHATVCEQVMALDLEHRYSMIDAAGIDHVCTGNSIYEAAALRTIGLFDESLGYGYDNDVSYRLQTAGYRLAFVRGARSLHRWRHTLGGYFMQQYGFGYGRLDVVAKHPRRFRGDTVSPAFMMLHPLLTLIALVGIGLAALVKIKGGDPQIFLSAPLLLLALLAAERLVAGITAAVRFRRFVPLLFPMFHAVRDVAWVAAFGAWSVRRAFRRPALPAHSMMPGAR